MANTFDPKTGGKVTREDAEKWMKKFDDERQDKNEPTSVFFGKDFLQSILDTPDCAGISFFFVKKHSDFVGKDAMDLVLLPRTADGALLWPNDSSGKDVGQSAYDQSKPCPPYC